MQHEFSLRAEWATNTDRPHPQRGFTREVTIHADGPGELPGSAAKPFHGDATRWNPEQLLLAALVECHILSYLYVAGEAEIEVEHVSVRGELTLEAGSDGGQISSATLYPEVVVADTMQLARARELHDEAHRQCFIARSVNFPISLEVPHQHQMPQLPQFSNRLGAPIAVLKPRRAKKPSQVSGNEDARLAAIRAERDAAHEDPNASAQETKSAAEQAQKTNAPSEQTSFYDQVGGEPTFRKLVHEFYQQVEADPEFKAMYPEEDLGPAEQRLRLFLIQYWGGPTDYSQLRGHPRLRARHMPFHVDTKARDTWLKFMRNAMDTLDLAPLHYDTMWDYFERAARAMQNQH
ncbi:hypothetical protein GCM10009720_25140 [Yaniella flava]|uniref:Hemoglobin n=1 Tax=Yaniella flava TaxID=287930 RepID=A0ABP5GCQ5_9MICC